MGNGFGYHNGFYSGEESNEEMNGWNGEVKSPAGCYIEWRFEQRCRQLNNGFKIITEWRMRKQQYVAILDTIAYDFQHYSRHDESHSIAILEAVERLLGKKRVDLLSAGDLWLLLEAAYSHDIGMSVDYEELRRLWAEDEEFQEFIRKCIEDDLGDLTRAALYYREMDRILRSEDVEKSFGKEGRIVFQKDWPVLSEKYLHILITEYLRKHHAKRVEKLGNLMDPQKETQIPLRLYQTAVLVSQIHGRAFEDILKQLKYATDGFGSGTIHPQFAAAMLRIGDLLDIDNNRFNPYSIRHFGRLPFASLLHLKKHRAITHISVTESEVVVEANADQYEVALLTEDWFRCIEEEVKNLICCWNDIMPEALQGCMLHKSSCRVFLKGQRFTSDLQKGFTVDKQKLIRLLIGTEIYDSEMDFLREYLQNAMDATKMQLWLDLKAAKYKFQRNSAVELKDINPFDLGAEVYRNYPIRIFAEWNNAQDHIRLHITDSGIGIEKEYFEGLSKIGTGWRGRKQYHEELASMPAWLYPTGGFGIGIHAAFMITDTVIMFTRSEKDSHGHQIILKNPDSGGTVSVEKVNDYRCRGTEIVMEISPEKFQRLSREDFPKGSSAYGDEFDPDNTLCYVQQILYGYICKQIINPLFPIIIQSSIGEDIEYTGRSWPEEDYWKMMAGGTKKGNEKGSWLVREQEYQGVKYLCICQPDGIWKGSGKERNQDQLIIWDPESCIMMSFYMGGASADKFVCYKNVVVQKDARLGMLGFRDSSFCIDFMGFHAEECLMLHRGRFKNDFPLEEYISKGYGVYLLFLKWAAEKMDSEEKWKERWEKYTIQLLRVRLNHGRDDDYHTAYGNIEVRKLRKKQNEGNVSLEIDQDTGHVTGEEALLTIRDFYRAGPKNDILSGYAPKSTDAFVASIDDEEESDLLLLELPYGSDPGAETMIGNEDLKAWTGSGEVPYEGDKTAVLNMLTEGIGIIKDTATIDVLLHDPDLSNICCEIRPLNLKFLMLFYKTRVEVKDKSEICKRLWADSREMRSYITCTDAKVYKTLWVKQLPYSAFARTDPDKLFLISPINVNSYNNVVSCKRKRQAINYIRFRELVWGKKDKENADYRMLMEWTLKHQSTENLCSEKEIKAAYEELLQDIFQECIESK